MDREKLSQVLQELSFFYLFLSSCLFSKFSREDYSFAAKASGAPLESTEELLEKACTYLETLSHFLTEPELKKHKEDLAQVSVLIGLESAEWHDDLTEEEKRERGVQQTSAYRTRSSTFLDAYFLSLPEERRRALVEKLRQTLRDVPR